MLHPSSHQTLRSQILPRLAPGSGPQLVPRRAAPPDPSPLARWHLLSLDAPTVAALWTWFIARCAHVALPWTATAAMFLAVWMIYAADRLLDARRLDAYPLDGLVPSGHHYGLEERHYFHHRHRSRFLLAIAAAAIALAAVLPHLAPRSLALYTLLATLLAAWMLLIHARPPQRSADNPNGVHRLPKELAVGLFFPAAVFIPTVARAPELQLTLLPSAALLAALCTLNCLLIYRWEHPPQHRSIASAHWTTLAAIHHVRQLGLLLVAASLLLATALPAARPEALACALGAALLLLLHRLRLRIAALRLRAAADLVLLTPVLLLPLLRLAR